MDLTKHYKLKKPEATDVVNIEDLNENADMLDAELTKVCGKINKANNIIELTVPAASWSGTVPYTAKLAVSGILATDTPLIDHVFSIAGVTATDVKNLKKAYNCIDKVVTSDGYLTLYAYSKKPLITFYIKVKGVL